MDQRTARTHITAALKKAGFKPRKGRLRLLAGDLWWYVDVLADSPSPHAGLVLELGCWPPAVRAQEPEGGAADCPFLGEVPIGEDPGGEASTLIGWLAGIDSVRALAGALGDRRFASAMIDTDLRATLKNVR